MSSDHKDDRRFKPTRRRLRLARREGQVAKSQDFSLAMGLVAWTIAAFAGAPVAERIRAMVDRALSLEASARLAPAAELQWYGREMLSCMALLWAPAVVLATAALLVQTGPLWAMGRLKPDLGHLNPGRGLFRGLQRDALVDLAKQLVVTAALGLALLQSVADGLARAVQTADSDTASAVLHELFAGLQRALVCAAVIMTACGAFDVVYQKFAHRRRLMMTTQEFKRDRKIIEGDRRTKARRRSLHREWMQHTVIQATQSATAVVTNPTHFAVALAYDPDLHAAPVITAKGEGHIAALIRSVAEGAQVPVIENVPLARRLHADVMEGDCVPEELFVAVAEIIVWARRLREGAAPSSE